MKRYSAPVLLVCLAFCATQTGAAPEIPALKDVFKDDFVIGASLNPTQFNPSNAANPEVALIKQQFNAISPENCLKWRPVHPQPNQYNFRITDNYVDFGLKNNMFIVGHNLIWHNATPDWVFENESGGQVDRDTLIKRMHDHISTVVGRYKGKIKGWDVVNEAVMDDGSLRTNRWYQIIGEDYLIKAYQFAHEADPDVQLYYNDYSVEIPAKRAGVIRLIKKLQAAGIPLYGVGDQGHYKILWPPTNAISKTIDEFAALGIKVMITELDVSVLPTAPGTEEQQMMIDVRKHPSLNPYTNGLPDAVQQELARRYADLFTVFLQHRSQITRVTFWNVADRSSWLNGMPVRRRTDYPLLFDRECQPKPAFYSVLEVAKQIK
jgi:endo-1,4-beta-xylanase